VAEGNGSGASDGGTLGGMTRFLALLVLVSALATPALAASKSTTLHISALAAGLRYSTTHLAATHGLVTIVMVNRSVLRHDIAIKGHGIYAKGKIVGKGGISRVSVQLKAGTYQFLCTVDAHAAAGMKGTLVVR
jgi:plastocyanin